jgi:outer membrane murein-binding lipoprotein Lpp
MRTKDSTPGLALFAVLVSLTLSACASRRAYDTLQAQNQQLQTENQQLKQQLMAGGSKTPLSTQ